MEYDIKNLLANFVVFKNIDSRTEIKNLLKNPELNISFDLFITLINICGDNINNEEIIKNVLSYKSKVDNLTLVKSFIDKSYVRDIGFILNLIYQFKFTEEENNKILDELYNDKKTNKIIMLAQLKALKLKHNDFEYNQQKFDDYLEHWKKLKEKQIELRKNLAEQKNAKVENDKKNNQIEKQLKNRKKLIYCVTSCLAILVLVLIICLLI